MSIREKNGSVFVEGISRSHVVCANDVMYLLDLGDQNRCTAKTLINPNSSRSHAALMVNISFLDKMDHKIKHDQEERYNQESNLVLIDLAGSERSVAAGGNYTRLEEARNINLSLSLSRYVAGVLNVEPTVERHVEHSTVGSSSSTYSR